MILGREVGEGTALQDCRLDLELDKPAVMRYADWLGNFLSGDWGQSYSTNADILPLVSERVGNS